LDPEEEEETRQRILELLREFSSIMEELRVARGAYRKKFHELSARLLLQTRTWRSLKILKRRRAIEISTLQQKCNELMEEFVKVETIRGEQQQEFTRLMSEIPPSGGLAKVELLKRVNEFNLRELSEGLSVRWDLLDQIEGTVVNVEELVRRLGRGRSETNEL
jgi:hypothetical protein